MVLCFKLIHSLTEQNNPYQENNFQSPSCIEETHTSVKGRIRVGPGTVG